MDYQLAGDVTAGHRNDFDGQGEFAQHADPLALINNTNELTAGSGDDFFPRQRSATTLDQSPMGVEFICAINVNIQCARQVQFADFNAVRLQ